MRNLLPLLFLLAVATGCSPAAPEATPAPEAVSSQPAGGGVAPIGSGAAGGLTPMAGAENLGGGTGGGIASAAKGQAGRAAGMAGGGSMSQMPVDGE